MPRSTNAVASRRRRKKVLKRARGFYGQRHKTFRKAKEAVTHALMHAYKGRRVKKRQFRGLWITRVGIAGRAAGLRYSALASGLRKAEVRLNRKMLSELAVRDPKAFEAVTALARKHLPAAEMAS